MKQMRTMGMVFSILLIGLCSVSYGLTPRVIPTKPAVSSVPVGFDRDHIEVKFIDDADIGISSHGVPFDRSGQLLSSTRSSSALFDIASAGGDWKRMSATNENDIDNWVATAERNLDREIADLNNYFILTVPEGVTTVDWLNQLNAMPEVEIALALPLPVPAPAVPGNFQGQQGYLLNAPGGFGFQTAWGVPGGAGGGLAVGYQSIICDLEYSWNQAHLEYNVPTYLYPPAETPVDPYSDNNHGTAVIGEMSSLNNGWGTIGASYESIPWLAPTNYASGWNIGAAMLHVMTWMPQGGVFLIEQQFAGPNYVGVGQNGLIPVEWWQSWYNVIVTAVGNGIHVVEAAGNGAENLDAAIYATGNGGHWPFLPANHSGAIIVGAGAAPAASGGSDVDRSRLWYSNYGSRLDVQGWGERVVTTGYGTLYSAEGVNLWYANSFGGTSSASPLIASCVANIAAMYRVANGVHIPPAALLTALKTTGSPQQAGTYPITQNIGPRPDMVAAWASIPSPSCCLARGDIDHNGVQDISDLTYLVDWMFRGGPAPPCMDEADVNKDGANDVSDLTYLVDWMFKGGPAPLPC